MCHSANLIAQELVNKDKTEGKLSNVTSIEKFSDYDKAEFYIMYEDLFKTSWYLKEGSTNLLIYLVWI